MKANANVNMADPREHVNENPTDDFGDLMKGFTYMFGFMFVIFFAMVAIKYMIS
ncbi:MULTISPECIES: YqzM family protein [unclassified Paenibacillus]|uniref:YqzM family protein n=1 Tax=unclassified Paenibacillus TaxID=185978 RepID=UPI001C11F6A5|nr:MULTISPECIES: YqzM family protein [unclassified Paenibacillus]MBU5441504.1 YqzM family protein [Paenibacillus sp. MSJ-34]CAH0118374.1 hypothetical protein PAE9249_00861 [Paenibacillus sp. CECT 9249]